MFSYVIHSNVYIGGCGVSPMTKTVVKSVTKDMLAKVAADRLNEYSYLFDLPSIVKGELKDVEEYPGSRVLIGFFNDRWGAVASKLREAAGKLSEGVFSETSSAFILRFDYGDVKIDVEWLKNSTQPIVSITPRGISGDVYVENILGVDAEAINALKAALTPHPRTGASLLLRDAALALTLMPGRHPLVIDKVYLLKSKVSILMNIGRGSRVDISGIKSDNALLRLYMLGILLRPSTRVNAYLTTSRRGVRAIHTSLTLYLTDRESWLLEKLKDIGANTGAIRRRGKSMLVDVPFKSAESLLAYILPYIPGKVVEVLDAFKPRQWETLRQVADTLGIEV